MAPGIRTETVIESVSGGIRFLETLPSRLARISYAIRAHEKGEVPHNVASRTRSIRDV